MSTFSILSNQPPLDHESFAAHRELEALLKSTIRGDVLFDLASRALFAADSSNYRQLPIGVIYPRSIADVEAAIAACRATGAAILPRGAGTSLAGQCVNVAVVFDFSRYMHALHGIDVAKQLATVEPGIVLDRLRDAAEVHHLTFAPDPATHSRCTLGGIIGNNSCGVHGLLGGKAVDNVESLDVILYDGTRLTVGSTSDDQLAALIHQGGRVGEIYTGLARIRDKFASEIRKKFPNIPRRVSGYNLDQLLSENNFNVARALGRCGAKQVPVRKTLLHAVDTAKDAKRAAGPLIGLGYFEKDVDLARTVEKMLKKESEWHKRGLMMWLLARTGDTKSGEFMNKEILPPLASGAPDAQAMLARFQASRPPAGAPEPVATTTAAPPIDEERREQLRNLGYVE